MKYLAKEMYLYDRIHHLWFGTPEERQTAFECELLLNDECSGYSLEEMLDIIERKIAALDAAKEGAGT